VDLNPLSDILRWIWRSTKRIVVFVVGVALILVGLAMFVLPGPGIVVVFLGFAVLATEFVWAEVALDKAKKTAGQIGSAAKSTVRRVTGRGAEPADGPAEGSAGDLVADGQPAPPPST
jgi:uncharacterized protein (TIGR02611 family)